MTVLRVMPILTVPDLDVARSAYVDVLGLSEVMNLGWIATYADDTGRHQVSVMTRDQTAVVNPQVSIEVDDVDAAYDAARGPRGSRSSTSSATSRGACVASSCATRPGASSTC